MFIESYGSIHNLDVVARKKKLVKDYAFLNYQIYQIYLSFYRDSKDILKIYHKIVKIGQEC